VTKWTRAEERILYIYAMKILLIISALFLSAFRLHGSKASVSNSYNLKSTDSSKYVILNLYKIPNSIFDKNCKPTTLSEEEVNKIEKLIDRAVIKNNKDSNKYYQIKNPENYYKQLVAIINSKGEKEVWVNCFCSVENISYWRKSIVAVLDGGFCYFNLKINLSKNKAYDFMVNNFE
jgi:hypothetical protein